MPSAIESFENAIVAGPPPDDLSPPLRALWFDARGDWDAAHKCVDELDRPVVDADAMWVHAYLHRKEGDALNAGYWYGRAGRKPCTAPLAEEWRALAVALLAKKE